MLMFRTVLALTLVAALVSPVTAQERIARVSLDEAVSLALRYSPTIGAKEAELRSQKANEVTAGLRPNPTASYAAEQYGLPGTDPQHTVIISQTIETGGKRGRRIDAARAATTVTGHQLNDVRRQTILAVKTAFVNALVAREQVALAEENLRVLDQTERLQRLRVEKGDLSRLELTRIEVQRFAFERDAADARQALAAARIAVRTTTGAAAVLADGFEVEGTLAVPRVRLDRAELVSLARDHRPDFRAAVADRQRAQADHALARANAWWDFAPQLEYQRIGPDNTIGFGVSMPLRLFDRNQGEIERTRSEIDRVTAAMRVTELQVLSDVDTDLSVALTQRDRVTALRETYLPKAQSARDIVEYAYRRGGASLLDFLDAQRTYRETAVLYLQALGAYITATYQLEADIGAAVPEGS
jgi:cobalt-zinc-cadmium efflux system outer membrane protein